MSKKSTCANMQRCDINRAESHIFRHTILDYTRKDLEDKNIYRTFASIKDTLAEDRKIYEETVGQMMQPKAAPIREIVVYNMTEEAQAQAFKVDLEKTFGVSVLSFAIHLDEGYDDVITHKWHPNYHAHVIIDTMCREHTLVWTPVKSNGIAKKDEQGKTIWKQVDNYGKTIKFTKSKLSLMQDLAAKATGQERGTPSTRRHINARKQKVLGLEKDIAKLEAKKVDLETDLAKQKARLDTLSNESQLQIDRAFRAGIESIKSSIDEMLRSVTTMATLLGSGGRRLPEGVETIAKTLDALRTKSTAKMPAVELQRHFVTLGQGICRALPLMTVSLFKQMLRLDDSRLLNLAKENQTLRKRVGELEGYLKKADEDRRKVDSLENDLKNLLLAKENQNILIDNFMRSLRYSASKEFITSLESLGLPKIVGGERWRKFMEGNVTFQRRVGKM